MPRGTDSLTHADVVWVDEARYLLQRGVLTIALSLLLPLLLLLPAHLLRHVHVLRVRRGGSGRGVRTTTTSGVSEKIPGKFGTAEGGAGLVKPSTTVLLCSGVVAVQLNDANQAAIGHHVPAFHTKILEIG